MNITVNELKDMLRLHQTVNIIDVREKLEYHTFNIGGENIPLGILLGEIEELEYNKNQPMVVVCQRGLRSETARRVLEGHGYTNVKNLTGGLLAWNRANS